MLLNLAADAAGGSIPILGDIWDFLFKAHARNLALLRSRSAGRAFRGHWSDNLVVAFAIVVLLAAFALPVLVAVGLLAPRRAGPRPLTESVGVKITDSATCRCSNNQQGHMKVLTERSRSLKVTPSYRPFYVILLGERDPCREIRQVPTEFPLRARRSPRGRLITSRTQSRVAGTRTPTSITRSFSRRSQSISASSMRWRCPLAPRRFISLWRRWGSGRGTRSLCPRAPGSPRLPRSPTWVPPPCLPTSTRRPGVCRPTRWSRTSPLGPRRSSRLISTAAGRTIASCGGFATRAAFQS